jgi:hypothetical protein
MPKGNFKVPVAINEPIKNYAPGSPERKELQSMLKELRSKQLDIPMYIGGKEVRSGTKIRLAPPHDHKHTLGHFHKSDKKHVSQAITAAMGAKKKWEALSWEHRASIFLKAAELIAGPSANALGLTRPKSTLPANSLISFGSMYSTCLKFIPNNRIPVRVCGIAWSGDHLKDSSMHSLLSILLPSQVTFQPPAP